jgi:hypothetical protein
MRHKKSTSSTQIARSLTPVERKALDLMKPGVWYDDCGWHGESLPYTIRRRSYVLDCLKQKGYVDHKVEFSVPGNPHSTYSLYRKPDQGQSVEPKVTESDNASFKPKSDLEDT